MSEITNPLEELLDYLKNIGTSTEEVARAPVQSRSANKQLPNAGAYATKPEADFLSVRSAFGDAENTGWLTGGASALASGVGAWTGLKQLKLSKDMFNFTKASTNRNLENQSTNYNTRLRDSQETRISNAGSKGGELMSADEYVKKHGVSGAPL